MTPDGGDATALASHALTALNVAASKLLGNPVALATPITGDAKLTVGKCLALYAPEETHNYLRGVLGLGGYPDTPPDFETLVSVALARANFASALNYLGR